MAKKKENNQIYLLQVREHRGKHCPSGHSSKGAKF